MNHYKINDSHNLIFTEFTIHKNRNKSDIIYIMSITVPDNSITLTDSDDCRYDDSDYTIIPYRNSRFYRNYNVYRPYDTKRVFHDSCYYRDDLLTEPRRDKNSILRKLNEQFTVDSYGVTFTCFDLLVILIILIIIYYCI